ncbi:MAG: sulfatase-like hydrolase/transferase [Oleispira sp.]
MFSYLLKIIKKEKSRKISFIVIGLYLLIFLIYLYSGALSVSDYKLSSAVVLILSSVIATSSVLLIMSLPIKRLGLFIAIALSVLNACIIFLGSKYGGVSEGIVSSIMDTNISESLEYASSNSFPLSVLLSIILFVALWKLNSISSDFFKNTRYSLTFIIGTIVISSLPFLYKAEKVDSPIWYLLEVVPEVRLGVMIIGTLESRRLERESIDSQWKDISSNKNGYTYVVIIGESAQKKAFHFYGNSVNTTEEIKLLPGWTIISDAIAPAVLTRTSVVRLLSINEKNNVNVNLNIIDLAKASGLKTYWFSNQGAMGFNDTPVTRIAKRADETLFHNFDFSRAKSDFVLLDDLKRSINSKGDQLFFLHTIGSHSDFCKRTSEALFSVTKRQGVKDIDCYHDSILNTFHFIKGVQSMMISEKLKYKIIYLSDHGLVDVEDAPYKVHGAGRLFSREALEVPLIFIDDSKAKGVMKDATYFLRDFPHTFADWIGVESLNIDETKSVLSMKKGDEQEPYVIDSSESFTYFE